ncbi:GRB10-interacting GYF protein 2-like isoform X2 [Lingula anatina]|uniref:GRB10-interacting GYF protein 2-like isoform X2 n=1 Tax=Lingula anatina TaxID=7574 RepID=A0A1S3H1U4_LINAN|nr:GRB10-interacting GYF protein 2-like isoform X2 [Lingula anatina]|eukprot:XP_013379109.1 GRB10-interacting GYF protein 2-like isoform X2 [Lingula anatina]
MLLREVITLNPFAGGRAKWEEVVTNLNFCSHSSFNIKSCQARVRTLKLAFQEKTMQSLKASGTDEELTERESLLQELLYLLEENAATENSEKEKKKREEKENVDKGLKVREAAMLSQRRKQPADVEETQQPSTSTQPSTGKRRHSDPSFEEYFELRRRQQELETQRFQHETQRLEQERARDEKMFAMLAKLIEKNKN